MPNIFHRKSLRLPNWDYTSAGLYYVTIVTWEGIHHFGSVIDGRMELSDAGQIAQRIWNMIPQQFPHVSIDKYVIMPNHVHGIIEIHTSPNDHTRDRRVGIHADHANVYADHAKHDADRPHNDITNTNVMRRDGLEKIVRWFKGRVTFEFHEFIDMRRKVGMNANPTYGSSVSLWQRSFYEHIIRNDEDVNRIRTYIQNNPSNWQNDELNDGP